MAHNMYLTDSQYLDLLKRALTHLDTVVEVDYYDSTTMGDKYTISNVGLCNDKSLVIDSIRMFKDRDSMKHRDDYQKCPLDTRPVSRDSRSGCFYKCRLFKHGLKDLTVIKDLYVERIKEVNTIGT